MSQERDELNDAFPVARVACFPDKLESFHAKVMSFTARRMADEKIPHEKIAAVLHEAEYLAEIRRSDSDETR